MNKLQEAVKDQLRDDLPEFSPGDTVSIEVRVIEGGKERLQTFKGIVISKSGGGVVDRFRVRKICGGIGVERILRLHSPMINSLKVDRKGKVRRAKLHYLRGLTGKATRITEKR